MFIHDRVRVSSEIEAFDCTINVVVAVSLKWEDMTIVNTSFVATD